MVLMTTSDLPLRRIARGKVRDVYEVDDDRLLLVATDRVSAYDVVMAEPIPMKGAVLTQVSAWWFRQLGGQVRHHMISADSGEIAAAVPALKGHRDQLAGRAMLCTARHGLSDRVRDPRLSLGLGLARICRRTAPWPARSCRPVSGKATASIRRSSAPPPRPRAGMTRTSRWAACARCWATR